MARNTNIIPFTELQERAAEMARDEAENSKMRIRGAIQDTYTREIPTKFDWMFLMNESSIITNAEHKLGTVTINTQSTAAVFSNDASLTSNMTGRYLRINGNEAQYRVTYVSATDLTLSPSFEGANNASGNGYTIFDPFYALPGDFDRFPKDGGVFKWSGGKKDYTAYKYFKEWTEDYQSGTGTPERYQLAHHNTLGQQLIELNPPPKDRRIIPYEYIKEVRPLRENSKGTINIDAKGTTVSGNNDTQFTDMTTGDWLRVDAFGTHDDSSWYRILAITHDSSCKLATAFANSGVTSANYVISRAPEFPARLHGSVLFGALRALTLDQNDDNAALYNLRFAEAMSDAKKIFVTRNYSKPIDLEAEDFMYRR